MKPAFTVPYNEGYIRKSKAVTGTLWKETLIMFKAPCRGG